MPTWTPDDIDPADEPLVWMRSRDAVWNGSSLLSSLANRGSAGGSFTVQGSIGQGTNNGITGLRINAAGKYLDISLSGIGSSGTLFVFLVFKKLNADSSNEPGVLGSTSLSGTSGTVIWIEANDSGAGFIGDGYLQGPTASHGAHNATFPDTNLHCVGFTMGSAGDEIRADGASLTITDTPGSVATYGTETWHLFKEWGGTTDGYLNSDAFELFIFEDKPSTDIIERLEGWSLWEHGAEAQIASGHTYELAAPTTPTTATLSATLGAVTLSSAGTLTSPASGSVSATLEAVTASAAATLTITATLSAALEGTTLSAAGQLPLTATVSHTLDGATLSSAGQLALTGTLGASLESVGLSATGSTLTERTGGLTATLDGATLSAASRVLLWSPSASTAETWTAATPTATTWTAVGPTAQTWTQA